MLAAVAALKNVLQGCMPCVTSRRRIAILFTGGLDSTVLAALAAHQRPVLVFGVVLDRDCRVYNARSILYSRRIAAILGLTFKTIGISQRDYHDGIRAMLSAGVYSKDRDLPAAAFLVKALRAQGVGGVVSGMGSNELFSASKRTLSMIPELQAAYSEHRLLGRAEKIIFRAPFLEEPVIKVVRGLVRSGHARTDVLGALLAGYPDVCRLMKKRVSGHSMVPKRFLPVRMTVEPEKGV
jgi:asparagine synthetase B (glutamine-hydrolysing)